MLKYAKPMDVFVALIQDKNMLLDENNENVSRRLRQFGHSAYLNFHFFRRMPARGPPRNHLPGAKTDWAFTLALQITHRY